MKRFFIYIPIILLCSILLTGCTKKEEDVDVNQEDTQKNEQEDEKTDSDDLGYLSNPEDFTKIAKSIGTESDSEYTIDSLESLQENGYYSFTFVVSTTEEDSSLPLFAVEPVLEKGVYRITINGVSSDNSGLQHQQSSVVDKGAITGIYRAVTSVPNISIYEIGFLANNPFTLEYADIDENTWSIVVKVAYDLKYSPPTIDFGNTEFSSEEQTITGMNADDGVRISTYSYSVSGGVLKFAFSTSSGTSNPIPSVEARYDEMNILEVKFPSLSSDKVSTWGNTIALPGGLSVAISRSGEISYYRFGGIGGKKPFKLSATQSPNQVIVEIKLN
jgi:major membrane immunogen (membrane-anchored lipoprotein)